MQRWSKKEDANEREHHPCICSHFDLHFRNSCSLWSTVADLTGLRREIWEFDLRQHVCLFPTLKIPQSLSVYIAFSSEKEGFQIVAINHFSFKTIKLKVFFSKFNRDFNVKRHNRITEQNAPERLNNQLKQEVIIE